MTAELEAGVGPVRETISRESFANAMSVLASGVAIVTCRADGRPWGMTVTAFASVSAAPPTVLVSLCSTAVAADAIAETGSFGVSLLAAEQTAVAHFGSAPGEPKFLERFVDAGFGSTSPAVRGALAHLDCVVTDRVEVADHLIFFGRVRTARASRSGLPLLYHRRRYAEVAR